MVFYTLLHHNLIFLKIINGYSRFKVTEAEYFNTSERCINNKMHLMTCKLLMNKCIKKLSDL